MAKFNPITDLMPIDSSNESVDESSEQIKVIRTQLIQTRNSLSNVVNIIKTKNSLLDRDLDTIKSLNDRLQRTIPRIPIMRGEAGVLFGDTIEEEKKKSGLNIPMLPPRVPMEEEVVTYSRPLIKQAANIVGNIFNIGLILGGVRSLISKPKVISPPGANKIVPVTPGVLTPKKEKLIERVLSFLKAKKLARTSKKEGFAFSSKRFGNIPSAEAAKYPRGINLTFTSKKSNALVSAVRKASRRNASNFDDVVVGADKQLAEMKEALTERLGQLNPKRDVKQYDDLLRSIKKINKDQSKIVDLKTEFIEKTAQTTVGGNLAKDAVKQSEYQEFFDKFLKGSKTKVKSGGRKKVNRRGKNVTSEDKNTPLNMFIKSILEGSKDKVEARPMNNDIAMLNTDTGITNTVIIITDPPTA